MNIFISRSLKLSTALMMARAPSSSAFVASRHFQSSPATMLFASHLDEHLFNNQAILLDVRTEKEFLGASPPEILQSAASKDEIAMAKWVHIPVNPPVDAAAKEALAATIKEKAPELLPSKTDPVMVYCASGKRAELAIEVLQNELGYSNVQCVGAWCNVLEACSDCN